MRWKDRERFTIVGTIMSRGDIFVAVAVVDLICPCCTLSVPRLFNLFINLSFFFFNRISGHGALQALGSGQRHSIGW